MKPKLIDTSRYADYSKLMPFVEAMKTFNIDGAIKDIKSDFQKDAENVEKEYWFHLINTNEESGYYSNWAYGDEEVPDDDERNDRTIEEMAEEAKIYQALMKITS